MPETAYIPEPRPTPFTTPQSRNFDNAAGGNFSVGAVFRVGVDGTDIANLVVDPDSASPFLLTRHTPDTSPCIMRIQKKGTLGNVDGAAANVDNIGRLDFYAWDGAAFAGVMVLQATAAEAFTPTAHAGRLTFNCALAGTTTNLEVFRISATQVDARNNAVFAVAGTQVVGPRNTGWVTFTGTANKNAGALDTGTATTAQVAQVLKSVVDALILHGLIGT